MEQASQNLNMDFIQFHSILYQPPILICHSSRLQPHMQLGSTKARCFNSFNQIVWKKIEGGWESNDSILLFCIPGKYFCFNFFTCIFYAFCSFDRVLSFTFVVTNVLIYCLCCACLIFIFCEYFTGYYLNRVSNDTVVILPYIFNLYRDKFWPHFVFIKYTGFEFCSPIVFFIRIIIDFGSSLG